jgi:cyanophycinase
MRLGVATGLCWLLTAGFGVAEPGRLVIAGGAVERDNAAVHGAMIAELSPTGRVAVIPSASGEPARSAAAYVETLAQYGVAADRIDIVRLALMDDSATPDVDESAWAHNATDAAEIAKIEAAEAIWFTGGDQVRTTTALLAEDGGDTPMLAAIRARLAAGATVGGSSAGAAIMSAPMIARGDSLTALTRPVRLRDRPRDDNDDALTLQPGLGFFPFGLVDQHFDAMARLGRLTRALTTYDADRRIGFGVDENTAMLVNFGADTVEALGAGGVTVLDARGAQVRDVRGRLLISGVVMHRLAPGDRITLSTLAVTPAAGRDRIDPARPYYNRPAQSGAGMALPNQGLDDALGSELLDNGGADRLERVSFGGDGVGVRFVFTETPASWGAYGDGRYTISGVMLSIEPVQVRVRRIAQ